MSTKSTVRNIRINDEDWFMLTAEAEAKEVSVSEFVRTAALSYGLCRRMLRTNTVRVDPRSYNPLDFSFLCETVGLLHRDHPEVFREITKQLDPKAATAVRALRRGQEPTS